MTVDPSSSCRCQEVYETALAEYEAALQQWFQEAQNMGRKDGTNFILGPVLPTIPPFIGCPECWK